MASLSVVARGIAFILFGMSATKGCLGDTVYRICEETRNVCCQAEASSIHGCEVGNKVEGDSLVMFVDDCHGNPMPSSLIGCIGYKANWIMYNAYQRTGYATFLNSHSFISWSLHTQFGPPEWAETQRFNVTVIGLPSQPNPAMATKSTVVTHPTGVETAVASAVGLGRSSTAKASVYRLCEESQDACCLADASSTSGCWVNNLHMNVSDCEGKAMTESFDGCLGFTEVRDVSGDSFTFTGQGFVSAGHANISFLYIEPDYPCCMGETKSFNVTAAAESVTIFEEFAASQAKPSSTNAILV